MSLDLLRLLVLVVLGATEPASSPPPPVDVMLRYMPADCELVVVGDLRQLGAGLDALLDRWEGRDYLVDLPDVADGLVYYREMLVDAEALSRWTMGFNALTDLSYASFCGRTEATEWGLPTFAFVLHFEGDFPPGALPQLAASAGLLATSEPSPGVGGVYRASWPLPMVAYSPTASAIVVGTAERVEALMAAPGVVEAPASDSMMARVYELAAEGEGVRHLFGFAPTASTRFLASLVEPTGFARHLNGLDQLVLMVSDDRIVAEARAETNAAQRDQSLLFFAAQAWLEALPVLTRAVVATFYGLVGPSDSGYSTQAVQLALHRDEVLGLIAGSGVSDVPAVTHTWDDAERINRLQVDGAAGLILLVRQLTLIGLLAADGHLAQTREDLEHAREYWQSRPTF